MTSTNMSQFDEAAVDAVAEGAASQRSMQPRSSFATDTALLASCGVQGGEREDAREARSDMNTQGPTTDSGCVHLLWTGGWDSTFRLLQLLLQHRVLVVPHYLDDPTRPSTQIELETMRRISDRLRAGYPYTRELLRPLRISPVGNVAQDAEIDRALQDIREKVFIGSQYSWLPAYCKHNAIDEMELGVHVDDKVQALLRSFAMEFQHPGGFRSVRVDPVHSGSPEYTLFRYFSFPLFGIDKVGIGERSEAEGWSDIMDMTWFCHRPLRGRPCGICAPCLYTIEEGLAHRVPASRRILSYFYRRLALPMKAPLRQVRMSLRGRSRRAAISHGGR